MHPITIVFVCLIITHCFGTVIYIKMCIAHVEISFYFTPGINFSSGEKNTLNNRYTGQTGRYTGVTGRYTAVSRNTKPAGIPAKPAGIPVYPAGIPVGTATTVKFEFKFTFDRFRPVTGLTGPVNRYRSPAVRPVRSGN